MFYQTLLLPGVQRNSLHPFGGALTLITTVVQKGISQWRFPGLG